MNRYHIIAALVLVAVVAALGLTYKFYFEEKLKAYGEAEEELKTLSTRLESIQARFQGKLPDEYLRTVGEAIAPLTQAATVRTQFFNMNDFWMEQEIPEDVKVPMKFYYEREFRKKYGELQQDAMAHVPQVGYPGDIFIRFGAQPPENVTTATQNEVKRWLTQINFGSAIARMLIKANAAGINDIVLWPPRDEFGVLEMRTVGLSFLMRAEDLVEFLQSLERADRYFSVNALRIQNRNILSNPAYGSPYLEVEMLLTLSRSIEGRKPADMPTLASAGPGGMPAQFAGLSGLGRFGRFGADDEEEEEVPEESFWQKLWPW